MSVPVVVIIGRANVGKSTLYNKLTEKRSSIVNDTPGVTRDRLFGRAEWQGRQVILVDTGGVDIDNVNEIELQVKEQVLIAQNEADFIILVVDRQQGLTAQDRGIIEQVRRTGKAFYLAVNKVDEPLHEKDMGEFLQLGIKATYPISAEHGLGLLDLIDGLVAAFPEATPEEPELDVIKIAIVGKPNAGKSSLVNKLLNSERCIVSPIPGTTRDTVDTHLQFQGRDLLFIDTAGIRRKGKTKEVLDKFSVIMALKALDRCDIAVLVLDADEGVSDQDANIAGYAFDRGKGCIIVANKWDLIEEPRGSFPAFEEKVRDQFKFLEFAPLLTVSAKTGQGINKLLSSIEKVYAEYSKNITTGKLNDCFEKAILKNPMSSYRGKFLKLFYATQVKSCPPTFRCFVNYPQGIHFSYQRYMVNSLRKVFGFSGTPLRLMFSSRKKMD
ncbi:MAG: ribosome biogenesis GTPase Der [Nitrospinae bacterium]|jgi:GTPase|nr:ribosome biogenesis GTPase Der [Nitrospinota bacterium]MDA1109302.1 ribosome biogenesis GTPase Der [Nitrospinota bacterium]